jgi:16S rRNA (guanine527-N7)-methyltransferase
MDKPCVPWLRSLEGESRALGCPVEGGVAEQLWMFCELVARAPFRATASRSMDELRRKHVVDSLTALRPADVKPGERLLDVGSGAGFPGLVLAIARRDVSVCLLEPIAKKAAFLEAAAAALGVANVAVERARAEDLGRKSRWREAADCVVARGVAPMAVLVEYTLPLCRVGGRMVALKGPAAAAELAHARAALSLLGAGRVVMESLRLPGGDEPRVVVRVEKSRSSPGRYPRSAAVIRRLPL